MSQAIPKTITGGCLCGEVRYQIDFDSNHDWGEKPSTCQCTQCRKNCGSLVCYMHAVSASELTWLSKSSYTEYNSSPGCYRGFCKTCGSTISWLTHEANADIYLTVGTFDEEFLIGVKKTEDGKPNGGYGLALANPGKHVYIQNEIPGVTDSATVSGTRFWKNSDDGPMMEKSSDVGDRRGMD